MKGQGTAFKKELGEKYTVSFGEPKQKFFIKRVIDDELAQIENPEGKSFAEPVDTFSVIPKLDQKEVFGTSWNLLKEGKVVGIFPEGGSHDQTNILPIKAGVAIIYMGAVENYNPHVQILACGINYDNGHKFRSTAVVEFGFPYQMPEESVADYRDPELKKGVIGAFLGKLSSFTANFSETSD